MISKIISIIVTIMMLLALVMTFEREPKLTITFIKEFIESFVRVVRSAYKAVVGEVNKYQAKENVT